MFKKDKQKAIDNQNSKSNGLSFNTASNVGIGVKKFWMTSGLPDVRDSHKYYESLGSVPMDYEYAPGLKFPGDPDCKDPNEVDDCRCTIGYDVD
jgi:hypothetical protein